MPYSKPKTANPPRPGRNTGYTVTRTATRTETFRCRSFEPVCGGVRLDGEPGGTVFVSGGTITIKKSSGA